MLSSQINLYLYHIDNVIKLSLRKGQNSYRK